MSFSDTESKEFRASVALELLRYKMKQEVSENPKYPSLNLKDINECLVVAGVPFVTEANELDVVEITHEETEVEA